MDNAEIASRFATLSTPLIADAVLALKRGLRLAPPGLSPVTGNARIAGRALPVRHRGSVDVFLEAIDGARPGDVLVIDNEGRSDEACIGDLTALEAWLGGLAGLVVWGLHRDTAELEAIPIGVFTYGAFPAGPRRLDPPDAKLPSFGGVTIEKDDVVFADADGGVFVEAARVAETLEHAETIFGRERRQADLVRGGRSLREQLHFSDYLAERARDPAYTLRAHLSKIGGAIEV